MAELIVKKLQFPGSDDQYLINAAKLNGKTYEDIKGQIDAVSELVTGVASFDALIYKGILKETDTLPSADKGDVYKVGFNGTLSGTTIKVELGDMLICNTDETPAGTSANWDVLQGNVDVEAILDHTHEVEVSVTPSKSEKTLSHDVTPNVVALNTTFSAGSATVTGDHGHTASGSATFTAEGSVSNESLTPAGVVTLTAPSSAATGDVTITTSGTVNNSTKSYVESVTVDDHASHNHAGTAGNAKTGITATSTADYTPEGTVAATDVEFVTSVSGSSTTVSAHSASSENAGGFTPSGSVTVNDATAGGSVAAHKHNVAVNTSASDVIATAPVYSNEGDDSTLVFNKVSALTSATASEDEVAPTFTGVAHNHGASFSGTAVAAHKHTITVADHAAFIPSVTTEKSAHAHTFTGTSATIAPSITITDNGHEHAVTTEGVVLTHAVTAPTTAHAHTFTGDKKYIHAAFTGTAADHNHTFTGTSVTANVGVTVNDFVGDFTGSATGTVTPSVNQVLTGVSIAEHKISTVDSISPVTVTTGKGSQE